MVKLSVRTHPKVLFAYEQNHFDLRLKVENAENKVLWAEADISVPGRLSLAPTHELTKGRVRVGIIQKDEYLEKSVRVYSSRYTQPQMYCITMTLYAFDADGVIMSRQEKSTTIRCELKKHQSF